MTPRDDCEASRATPEASRPSRRIAFPATHALLALVVLFGAVAPGIAAAADTPTFEENIEHTTQGEVAEIAITVPDGTTDPMTVEIGSEDVNFHVNATVSDADGDGSILLRLDTATAGEGEPTSYLEVPEGDELESTDQTTPEIKPPLDEGDYDLALWYDDEQVDVGTLVLAAPETTDGGADDASGTTFVYEGDQITLDAAKGQVVRGETTLDPGTSIVVRMRSSGASSPFLKSVETTVTEQGTFEATFDLSQVPEGATFTVSARGNGSELASAEGQISCENGCPTTAPTPTATPFPTTSVEPPNDGLLEGLGPLSAMALGAVLAVVGVGVLLGVFKK